MWQLCAAFTFLSATVAIRWMAYSLPTAPRDPAKQTRIKAVWALTAVLGIATLILFVVAT